MKKQKQDTAHPSATAAPAVAATPMTQKAEHPAWMAPEHLSLLAPASLVFGPLLGLLIAVVVMRSGMKRMLSQQAAVLSQFKQREADLSSRERSLLISSLAGELQENRSKVDAYLIVYKNMLKNIQEGKEKPKYQRVGDIVQKHPVCERGAFEASLSQLSLLDMKLAGLLSKLYAALPADAEYINLDPSVPLPVAVQTLEGVISKAEALLPQIDQTLAALSKTERK